MVISLSVIAGVLYQWSRGRLDHAPWWAPLGGILIAAIPGHVMGGVLAGSAKTIIKGLLAKIPDRREPPK